MARKPRFYTDSQIYHIILRGNNQADIFFNQNDYLFFLNRLAKYSSELGIDVYGYCLMTNHVHMLIGKANKYLSLFVQKLANSYVYYFNHKYERTGHLFQGRFKSEPVNDDIYFKTVLRYILQNPGKTTPANFTTYQWSSYSDVCKGNKSSITNTEYIYELFGSKSDTITFISIPDKNKCMEYENKFFISDNRAIKLIYTLFKKNSYDLIKLDLDTQISLLQKLKSLGLSINQLVRITSIPKKIIKLA